MYIVKSGKEYSLSVKMTDDACCEILKPVIVIDGAERRGEILTSDANVQITDTDGIVIKDEIENLGGGIFKVLRSIRNDNAFDIHFKSIFEADTIFKPNHFVFPGFNYDISHCKGGVSAGEILNGKTEAAETSVINTPTGLTVNDRSWVFAYDRESIPSASVSENEEYVFAMFVSDVNKVSLESSCSLIKNNDGTYRHRIIHPISEMPYTYAHKNTFGKPMETYFILESGKSIELSIYMIAGVPKYKYYGTANLMEACTKIFPFRKTPELSVKKVWDIGISYMIIFRLPCTE